LNVSLYLSAPPYWKYGQPPEDVTAAEDESAQFNCEVEGVPTPVVKWFVNGVPINGMSMTSIFLFMHLASSLALKT